ncbi:MAG TPA: NrfD/PsrC family molybdoenzyme membrane anchor subunit [Dehalococcoidales bacterium]|nr:NrfD/PsrC family molybdoenzyme membrane anchor subunit [Dehalococcoidales bacterium]
MEAVPWGFGIQEAPAREWSEGKGALISVAMFLGGIAGGTYLVSLYFNNIRGMFIGWLFAIAMGLVDSAHLRKPLRVWRIALKANSSWISRGFIFVILFIGAAGLQLLLHLVTGNAAAAPGGAEIFFRVVAGILGFCVAIYSGFVVGFVGGIKFWSSGILPILVVIGGLAGGSAILMSIMAYDSSSSFNVVQNLARFMLAGYAIALFVHLWVSTYNSEEAKDSALLMLKGNLAGLFWALIIVVGVIVPLVLDFVAGANSTVLLIVSAALVLMGNLVMRYSVIKAGLYTPLISGK